MPRTAKTKKKHIAKKLIILIAIGLIGGAAFSFWYVTQSNKNSSNNAENTTTNQSEGDTARKLLNDKNYNGAIDFILSQKDYRSNFGLLSIYAGALTGRGDVDEALAVYSELEKNDSRPYYYRGQAARALAGAGRKVEAIAYYEQAIVLARAVVAKDDEESFVIANEISDYQWYIGELSK